jgi:hypothetical protein
VQPFRSLPMRINTHWHAQGAGLSWGGRATLAFPFFLKGARVTLKLTKDEVSLIHGFRLLAERQKLLVLSAVLGSATYLYTVRVHAALDNMRPLHEPEATEQGCSRLGSLGRPERKGSRGASVGRKARQQAGNMDCRNLWE